MITKPVDHETNQIGKRLLREALEALGWVINDVEEDYGIDSNVQVFDGKSPTGAWFHVQLKSSASPHYSADGTFISHQLPIDHARHYSLQMREPIFLIHADVASKRLCWYAPQLDVRLAAVLGKTGAQFVTLRIPTDRLLPATGPELLKTLDTLYLTLASRELTASSAQSFADSIKHFPNQEALHRAFQGRNDTLKLQKIRDLYRQRKLGEAKPRAEALLSDPDSSVETKFWARVQLEAVDYTSTLHAGKPQGELPNLILAHAKALQKLTVAGPKHLKFYSLIAKHAAELEILVHENSSLFMALHQHLRQYGDPMMALGVYARRSALTKRIFLKYKQCMRLVRYATNYPDRWMLGRALTKVIYAIGRYLITLNAEQNFEAEEAFAQSALQICKVAAWICEETGDSEGMVLAILSALMTTHSEDSEAYRWGVQTARNLLDPQIRADALHVIDRAVKRWNGKTLEGDFRGDPAWQIIQNMATSLSIDISDENSPMVRGLRIAAKDNTPERVLRCCEDLLVGQGATGPIAQQIWRLFNITTASSKVVHCTLHNFHVEGKELDSAHSEFKRLHCDSCPDRKPRPDRWRYTEEVMQTIHARHRDFVVRLAGTPHGIRYTNQD